MAKARQLISEIERKIKLAYDVSKRRGGAARTPQEKRFLMNLGRGQV